MFEFRCLTVCFICQIKLTVKNIKKSKNIGIKAENNFSPNLKYR